MQSDLKNAAVAKPVKVFDIGDGLYATCTLLTGQVLYDLCTKLVRTKQDRIRAGFQVPSPIPSSFLSTSLCLFSNVCRRRSLNIFRACPQCVQIEAKDGCSFEIAGTLLYKANSEDPPGAEWDVRSSLPPLSPRAPSLSTPPPSPSPSLIS